MPDSWSVKPGTSKKGDFWEVVNDVTGRVANETQHKDKAIAEKHCDILNRLFGDDDDKATSD